MIWNIVGAFIRNNPFGTEIAFRKGLERIGETVNAWDPSVYDERNKFDPDADVTLVFKWLDPGVFRDSVVAKAKGKKVLYQVDDLRFPHIKQMMADMLQVCDHALTFDDDGAQLALQYGYKSAKKILLTADNHLYRKIPGMQKDIDVSFVGSLSYGDNHKSRMKMLEIVKSMGVKLVVANELFDISKVNEIYNRSKIVLNHATDVGQSFGHGFGYQCRHFEAGFAGALVLSNRVLNEQILPIAVFDSERELKETVSYYLEKQSYREQAAWSLHEELLRAHTPEHRAQEMRDYVRSL